MHPLLAEDFAKALIEERLASARNSGRSRSRPRRHVRPAVGRLLMALGSRLAA